MTISFIPQQEYFNASYIASRLLVGDEVKVALPLKSITVKFGDKTIAIIERDETKFYCMDCIGEYIEGNLETVVTSIINCVNSHSWGVIDE